MGDSVYTKCLEQANAEMEQISSCRHLGSHCQCRGLLSCVIKMSWTSVMVMAKAMTVLKPTSCTLDSGNLTKFKLHLCVCVCVQEAVCLWRSEDNMREPILSFHHTGSRDGAQGMTLGGEHLTS